MIVGHQKQWQSLKKITESDLFSHAFLFSGQEKLGKKKVAMEWLSLIFGQNLEKGHPDLIFIEPGGKEIQIAQIRDLVRRLSLKPHSAPLKAALIDGSHLMNQEAQTSLLKTLEEPRGRTLLILISDSPEYLLPTILSRVQTVKFYPVKDKEMEAFLKEAKLPEKEREEILEVSSGRPGRAVDILSDSKKLAEFQKKVRTISKLTDSSLAERFQCAKDLSEDPQKTKESLDVWLSYFRKILLSKVKGKKEAVKYSFSKLKNIIGLIQETRLILSRTNVNSRLALERLMLEI